MGFNSGFKGLIQTKMNFVREPHFVEYTFFMCCPSGEMQPLPLVAWSMFMQWKQRHIWTHNLLHWNSHLSRCSCFTVALLHGCSQSSDISRNWMRWDFCSPTQSCCLNYCFSMYALFLEGALWFQNVNGSTLHSCNMLCFLIKHSAFCCLFTCETAVHTYSSATLFLSFTCFFMVTFLPWIWTE